MPQTYGERVLRFIGWMGGFYTKKAVLTRSARKIYEDCIDNIDYESFMKACGLPDTLHSWFLVAHLHIWLLLVRLKREGKDGSYLINQLVGFFWKDVQERMNLLGVGNLRSCEHHVTIM
jgi:cytochrome b pre-mRNA-processing protein 3